MASQLQLAPGQPRTLAYGQAIRKDLKLLEVDEELLVELLHTGLSLKGRAGEEAVLCSGSKTYAVKSVETTNLVLLLQEADRQAVPVAALGSHDANVPPQATPPGMLLGLGTQLQKNQIAAQRAPVVASALVNSHLELVPAAPRLYQLEALLKERQYGADPADDEQEAAMMQTDDPSSSGGINASGGRSSGFSGGRTEAELLARVQCSAAELKAALADRKALCIDGRYCTVDPAYQSLLLELVLLTAVEQGWPLSWLPGGQVAEALQAHGYDPRVTLHCLNTFGTPAGSGGGSGSAPASAAQQEGDSMDAEAGGAGEPASASAGGTAGAACDGAYALEETAVCLHFARKLLQGQPDWELARFQEAWQGAVPEGMLPSLEMLRGEALQHGGGTGPSGVQQPRRIKHLPLERLPQDAGARFAALFAEQTAWEWEELQPYVQSLRGPGQTAEALLLKYARASQQRPTDPVTYSLR